MHKYDTLLLLLQPPSVNLYLCRVSHPCSTKGVVAKCHNPPQAVVDQHRSAVPGESLISPHATWHLSLRCFLFEEIKAII